MKIIQGFFITFLTLTLLSFSIVSRKPVNSDSQVKFSIKNAGITVNGQFKSFTTNFKFNKANIPASIFNGVINVASIDTDIKKRDEHLKKEEYFDAAKHTGIVFKSTSVTAMDATTLKITGNLTIKAITKPITMEVKYIPQDDNTIFTTKLNLNRRDYGVGGSSIVMSDDVTIYLTFVKKPTELK